MTTQTTTTRRSPQMASLQARYGAATKAGLLRAIRDDYNRECGEGFTIRDAEMMLDGMLEAEYQRIAGGAYDGIDATPADAARRAAR